MANAKTLKLEIELVPQTAWYSNLRKKISKPEWDKIRKQAYKDSGNKCAICGAEGRLNCHEVWSYDDKKQIQILKGFVALCSDCHWIKHIGLAGIQASKGLLDMDKLINHFMKVNGVDKKTFDAHRENSFVMWRVRSQHEWKTDLSKWAGLIKEDEKHA